MRLLFPVLTLAILIGLFLFIEGIAARFSKNLEGVAKTYLQYVLLAAIWLSGAHVVSPLDQDCFVESNLETPACKGTTEDFVI
jgi:hypothetical protein